MGDMDQLKQLEHDMTDVKKELAQYNELLVLIKQKVDKIDKGLYGDPENDYAGLIVRQKELQKEVDQMRLDYDRALKTLHDKNVEQDKALKVRKNTLGQVLEWVKWGALIFLVLKGAFGLDTLFGGKFMP